MLFCKPNAVSVNLVTGSIKTYGSGNECRIVAVSGIPIGPVKYANRVIGFGRQATEETNEAPLVVYLGEHA